MHTIHKIAYANPSKLRNFAPDFRLYKVDQDSLKSALEQIPKAEKNTKNFLRIKLGIFLSGLSVFAQLYLFQPLLPELCRYYDITPEHSSLAVSAGTVGMAIGLFIFAFWADRIQRKKLMVISIILASILTISSSFAPNFEFLILLNLLKGVALSGVTAVALAYLSEEVSIGILGTAIGIYLSGNTIGGMSGRVITLLISGFSDWQTAVLGVGFLCLILGLTFSFIFPNSKHFYPQKLPLNEKLNMMKIFVKDRYLQGVFFIGFSVMGIFVSVYNYLSFRLEADPFSLPHSIIASVFLLYIVGVAGSMKAGKWSDKYSSKQIIWRIIVITIIGLLLMLFSNIYVLIIGLVGVTFGFFASHTLASRMVSQRAPVSKSTATCLYWLFYYLGSSFAGSMSGKMLSHFGWSGFIVSLVILAIVTLLIAVWIKFHKPKNLHLYNQH